MEHGMNGSRIDQRSIIDHDGSIYYNRSTVIESNAETVNGSGSTVVEKDEKHLDLNYLSIGDFDDTKQVMTNSRSMISARNNRINLIDLGDADDEYHESVGDKVDKNAQIEELKLALDKKTAEAREHFLTEKSLKVVISMLKKDLDHEREEIKKLAETVSHLQLNVNELRSEKAKNDKLNSKLEELSLQISNKTHEGTIRMSVPNISMMKENEKKYSNSVLIAGMSWEISAGKNKMNNTEYLEVGLWCMNLDSSDFPCTVVFIVRLIALDGRSLNCEANLCYTFKESSGYAYPSLISWENLLDKSKGYVEDDTIIIEVAMRAYPQHQ